ncbi:VWA domain-containing protein [Marivirga salinae]|uniref:VWA domain-containing protein n=1 Tax=Marivirga salinarum TaxID=3059078 RepID=A0AA51N8Z1_9BACT|nr:VWA domain-containing protein [Marivirga sp. BDSF4-3]WMN10987.1 VWA domain-containing protein [Marivirga sp. BDSF4-3]
MKKITKLSSLFLLLFIFSCHSNYEDGYGPDYSAESYYNEGDQYIDNGENPFISTSEQNVSTFSIDADGGSYANSRRFLTQESNLPPNGAVRIEEFINYFDLNYPQPTDGSPIAANGEVAKCPWKPEHKLIRIGIQGKDIPESQLPASNYVFLIDVSGSMSSKDKLQLLKQGFNLLVDKLTSQDKIAIVTYAGQAGLLLESTSGDQKGKIKEAINSLGSGGSTAGADGIITAYNIALDNFIEGGNNRIILGTDGDFNVGISDREELITLIEGKRDNGIFLTTLGVGRGNLNEGTLEQIANKGNGTYEYIDNVEQLKKVFIYEKNKFYTVAKDVKVQVDFNAEIVDAYRLIGYENRILNEEDFEDDSEDAGELGAGQSITAIYEIIPNPAVGFETGRTFSIDMRYKLPDNTTSVPFELDIVDEDKSFAQSSDYMKFTASVAAFGMQLIDSQFKGTASYQDINDWLYQTNLDDPYGYKEELKSLVNKASQL